MTTHPAPDDCDLWAAVCAQREGAFEILREKIARICTPVFRHSMVPPEARERLLQDVLVSVWEYAGKQRETPKNLPAFLKWRARGVLSVLRREVQARRLDLPVDDAMASANENAHPLDNLITEEFALAFQRCRAGLNPVLAAVWDARHERGMDPGTTAHELNIAIGTVAVRLHRAKDALMDCLQGSGAMQ